MPELLHRRATSIETPAAATPDHGTPGKHTRAGDGPAAAVASPSAVSRVKAHAGKEVAEGGLTYRVNDRGEFVVTDAPDAGAGAKGHVIAPEGAYVATWRKLAEILLYPDRRSRPAATKPRGVACELFDERDAMPGLGPDLPASDPTAVDANLGAAKALADSTTVPHTHSMRASGGVEGDATNMARRRAIVAGKVDKLKTMVCSELTSLTLQKTGVNLDQRYTDPGSNMRVAYRDAANHLAFADLYSVTMNQPDALEAILAVKRGGGTRITPGSPDAKNLDKTFSRKAIDAEPFEFMYVELTNQVSLNKGDVVGAAATVQQLGGRVIDKLEDRRPGDLQQWLNTKNGKTDGSGHSSQVWSARGKGVAYFGDPAGPTLDPPVRGDIPPGWYAVDGLRWVVGPTTDPGTVASLAVDQVQLIEANLSTTDATGIGHVRAVDKEYDPTAASSRLTSAGRLPSSKWADWKPSTPVIAGTIKPGGVVSSSSE